jgi:hypothetical protein
MRLTLGLDLDFVTKLTGTTCNLDSIVKELLKSGAIEDTVGGGLLEVDEEFLGGALVSHIASRVGAGRK